MSDNKQRILVEKMKKLVPNELKKNGWYGPSGKAAEVRNRGVSMIPDSERNRVRYNFRMFLLPIFHLLSFDLHFSMI